MGFFDTDHDGMVREGKKEAERHRRKSEALRKQIAEREALHRRAKRKPARGAFLEFGDSVFDAIGVGPSNKRDARRARRG